MASPISKTVTEGRGETPFLAIHKSPLPQPLLLQSRSVWQIPIRWDRVELTESHASGFVLLRSTAREDPD